MSVSDLKLCMGCMSPLDESGVCRRCSYDAKMPHSLDYLPPNTKLHDNYIVGKLLSHDAEGALYIGFDTANEIKVWIREYVPANISYRRQTDYTVQPVTGFEAQFKSLMADFCDLCDTLYKIGEAERIVPIIDVIYVNNSVYAVYRYFKAMTFGKFLTHSGGELTWGQAKKLLMPLFHTVSQVHKLGVIHRGISPENVLIDQSGSLWLFGFAIGAARTDKSEISGLLYDGYAAPEQYALNSWQGTWTDVYALAAITYKALTGTKPPESVTRKIRDNFVSVSELVPSIPDNVSEAIDAAMMVSVEKRTQSVDCLVADLLDASKSNTAAYQIQSPENRQRIQEASKSDASYDDSILYSGRRSGKEQTSPERSRRGDGKTALKSSTARKPKSHSKTKTMLSWLFTTLIATAFLGGIMWWIATTYLSDLLDFNSDATTSGSSTSDVAGEDDEKMPVAGDTIPKFVGIVLDDIKNNAGYQDRYYFIYKEAFNEEFPVGTVCDQTPVEGTKMPNKGTVTLTVSKGSEKVIMPDVVGKTLEEASKMLTSLEIPYQIIESYNSTYEEGIVAKADRAVGSEVIKKKDTVLLYTKKIEASKSEISQENSEKSSKSTSSRLKINRGDKDKDE